MATSEFIFHPADGSPSWNFGKLRTATKAAEVQAARGSAQTPRFDEALASSQQCEL